MAVPLPRQPPKQPWIEEEGEVYEGYRKRKRSTSPPRLKTGPYHGPLTQNTLNLDPPLPSQLLLEPETKEPTLHNDVANEPSLTEQLGYDLGDDLDFELDIESDFEFDFKIGSGPNKAAKSTNAPKTEPNDVFYFDTQRQRSAESGSSPQYISTLNKPIPWNEPHIETKEQPEAELEPVLCPEQQELVDLIMSDANVFYTGSAGCGKSTVLKAAVTKLQKSGRRVEIVAPTGISALQVNGQTTWSYMGWAPDHFKKPITELENIVRRDKWLKKRIRRTDVLILDEISMVENHHLERMNRCIKIARNWSNGPLDQVPPFGGLQLIVTGDFCQLPPVKPFEHCMECGRETIEKSDRETRTCPNCRETFHDDDKWAFRSKAWEECKFIHFHLKEIHRQSDLEFIHVLQKCRLGFPFTPAEQDILLNHECSVANATRLYCKKDRAQEVNEERFKKLATEKVTYIARDDCNVPHNKKGRYGALAKLKDHRMQAKVDLKVGMLVILQVNLNLKLGLCNGSMGVVCGFESFDAARLPKARTEKNNTTLDESQLINGEYSTIKEHQIREFSNSQRYQKQLHWPRVMFHNGRKRTIYPECTVNAVGPGPLYNLAYRTQVPLIAGWAMTIHKSQGMTLERVIVNLEEVFEEKQVYVALSRAKNLKGLKIEGSPNDLAAARGGNDVVNGFLRRKFPSVFL